MRRSTETSAKLVQHTSCPDCEIIFSRDCTTCGRSDPILEPLEDPITSKQLQRWIEGSLHSAR